MWVVGEVRVFRGCGKVRIGFRGGSFWIDSVVRFFILWFLCRFFDFFVFFGFALYGVARFYDGFVG